MKTMPLVLVIFTHVERINSISGARLKFLASHKEMLKLYQVIFRNLKNLIRLHS